MFSVAPVGDSAGAVEMKMSLAADVVAEKSFVADQTTGKWICRRSEKGRGCVKTQSH